MRQARALTDHFPMTWKLLGGQELLQSLISFPEKVPNVSLHLDDHGIDPDPVHAKFPPKELGRKDSLYRLEVRRWMNRSLGVEN